MTSVSHTTSPPATAATLGRPRVWAWPLAALLGFPIGGYVANLTVGAVDSVGPALAGGLIAGAVVGAAQWLALRQFVAVALDRRDEPRSWAPASPSARQPSTTASTEPT